MLSHEAFNASTTMVTRILQLTADSKASSLMLQIRDGMFVLVLYKSVTVGLGVFIVSPIERLNLEEGFPSPSCRCIATASLELTKHYRAE